MQVGNGFASVRTIIEDQPKTGFCEPQLVGNFGGFEEEIAEDLLVLSASLGNARDRFLWDDKHMDWGLGFNIVKGQD